MTINKIKSLDKYIIILDNIVPEELCDRILEEYRESSCWEQTTINSDSGFKHNPMIRNCDHIAMSLPQVINKNFHVRKNLDDELFKCAAKAINVYRGVFPDVASEIDTGYDLLRYKEGQFYQQHTDSFKAQQRSVSCSFHLNDDYEGGEFAFFDREIIARVGKGSIIMFPSNFMFPHEIMPVTSGTRYSIITWYV